MLSNKEISNAAKFYQIAKRDLHTLLVKESKSPLDYEGVITPYPYITSLVYTIKEEHKETYDTLVGISRLIENLLKEDLRLWGKTQGIKTLKVAPDLRCESVVMEIVFLP